MSERQSVIVPVLNGATHILQAIDSALRQLLPDDEVIVIDNGSGDDTLAMLRSVGDKRLIIIEEERPGPAAARNAGLGLATGTLISFLDHDDYWPDGRNAGLLAALSANPDANAAYGRLRVLVEPGCDDQGMAALDGTFAPSVGLHAHVFRRDLIDRTGPLDETMRFGEDTDYFTRIRQAGWRPAVYDGDAAVYRRHSANATLDVAAKRRGLMAVLARNVKRRRSPDA